MADVAQRMRSLTRGRIMLRDRLRKSLLAPWKRHLWLWWENRGGAEVAELILAFLTPDAACVGFTRDAELLLWSGHGWDAPRHVGTFRLFQIGSAVTKWRRRCT